MSTLRISLESVRNGTVSVSGLNVPDGEHVQVTVSSASIEPRRSIAEVRALLGGHVERFDDPFEPAIDPNSWEMLS